eukprot:c32746_g1_i1 orf=1-453(-)
MPNYVQRLCSFRVLPSVSGVPAVCFRSIPCSSLLRPLPKAPRHAHGPSISRPFLRHIPTQAPPAALRLTQFGLTLCCCKAFASPVRASFSAMLPSSPKYIEYTTSPHMRPFLCLNNFGANLTSPSILLAASASISETHKHIHRHSHTHMCK